LLNRDTGSESQDCKACAASSQRWNAQQQSSHNCHQHCQRQRDEQSETCISA